MNGEGGIGSAEEDLGYLRGDFVTGFDFWNESPFFTPSIDVPLGEIYATIAAGIIGASQQSSFDVGSESGPEVGSDTQDNGSAAVVPVIDPESETTTTVFEEPDEEFVLSDRPTDWGAVYDEYVILNPEVQVPVFQEPVPSPGLPSPVGVPGKTSQEDEQVATWTDIIGGAIDIWQGQSQPFMPSYTPNFSYGSGGPGRPAASAPTTVTVNTQTGKVTACRRRRRRKLLTNGDYNDLLRIATLPNNQNVRIGLAKAVR